MLPNLIIIGAMKCGTTSLHNYLNCHPQISMSKEKELNFFVKEKNWYRGIGWYESRFKDKAKIYGESSPAYSSYPVYKKVPRRMSSLVPESKLIYILRDPIERIISHYVHEYSDGTEVRLFEEIFSDFDENNLYLCRSKYHMQLERFLNCFSKEKILVLTQEDLYKNRLHTLRRVFRFLDVDDSFTSNDFNTIYHRTSERRRKNRFGNLLARIPVINLIKRLPSNLRWHIERLIYFPFSEDIERPELQEDLRKELIEFLQTDVNRLRALTGYNFGSWSL